MDRRAFNKVCTSLLAGAASLSQTSTASTNVDYPATVLVDQNDTPLNIGSVAIGSSHIFNYPYVTTPCFLIRLTPAEASSTQRAPLSDRTGRSYQWQGAAGPDQSLVAFSAICTHKMSHPAKPISHLNFRPEQKQFQTSSGQETRQSQVIMCCSEHSIYDPADGARVLAGPATQPLAAIALEVSDDGSIFATGTYGGNMFDEFLAKFGFRLAMEAGVTDAQTLTGETTPAVPADEYSRQQIKC